jgi:serine protease Do
VSFAEDAQIGFDTGMSFADCEVVYSDPDYDLAVLAFPNDQRPVAYGLRPAPAPGTDREAVVATGFPELAGKPSFQTTEGRISNATFELDNSDGTKTQFIQHTAPIDPGSSGGPLTSESGELLGVNTMFLVNKHSAFFAVPAKEVVEAVRAAFEIKQKRSDAAWKEQKLVEACKVLVGELESEHPRLGVLDDLISNKLVGDRGYESFRMVSSDKDFQELFVADPIDGMRKALLLRLLFRVKAPKLGGGVVANNTCTDIVEADAAHITTVDEVRSRILLARGPLELAWTFEHGHWRIAGGDLGGGGEADGDD